MLKEFKEFALKGNVIDMAVGIIIGAAFGKIITSFVTDILTPPIGRAIGKMDFSNMFINLSEQDYQTLGEAKKAGAATINYGLFLNATIDFLIIAFVLFLLVRQINRLKRQEPAAEPSTKECCYCLSKIPAKGEPLSAVHLGAYRRLSHSGHDTSHNLVLIFNRYLCSRTRYFNLNYFQAARPDDEEYPNALRVWSSIF